jgi:hypothetical protein
VTRFDDFRIQPPEEWGRLDIGEDDSEAYAVWVAADDVEQARTAYLSYRAADDEYAIQMLRMGCMRGTLREARKASENRPGTRVFRVCNDPSKT